MQRVADTRMASLSQVVPLDGTTVLEIGCGEGDLSVQIAAKCASLTAIDPDKRALDTACRKNISNAHFMNLSAESLILPDDSFDVVIFNSSLHHVHARYMDQAIHEAIAVCRPGGNIVVIEPQILGSWYDAERRFGVGNGDERDAKLAVRRLLKEHMYLKQVRCVLSTIEVRVDHCGDFVRSLSPNRNMGDLERFLSQQPRDCGGGHKLIAPHDLFVFQLAH